jgi:hypothetical protein
MQKKSQTHFTHPIRFRERERFANKPSESLPQRVVPALDMRCRARFFPHSRMLLRRDDQLLCVPEIANAMRGAVRSWNRRQQRAARRFRTVADVIGDDLPCSTAQCQPHLYDFRSS